MLRMLNEGLKRVSMKQKAVATELEQSSEEKAAVWSKHADLLMANMHILKQTQKKYGAFRPESPIFFCTFELARARIGRASR